MSKHWKADEALTVLSYLIIMVAHYILFLLLYVSVHECGGTRVCACAHVCGGMHMEASKQSQIPFCLKCCSPFLWSGVSLAQGLLARLNWLPASSKDLPASASPAEILSACTPAWLPPPPPLKLVIGLELRLSCLQSKHSMDWTTSLAWEFSLWESALCHWHCIWTFKYLLCVAYLDLLCWDWMLASQARLLA